MENKEQLRPLTREERKFLEENYHLIMDFMKKSKLDAEEFFDIVVFDFLLSVEKYLNDPQLQAKCSFEVVSYMYMKRAVFVHFRKQKAQKRSTEAGSDISLDSMDMNISNHSTMETASNACKFYIDNYGSETFIAKKKDNERAEYIRSADIEDIKAEVIEAAINEAREEVIKLLGGVISGMNVGQPVIMQAANSEAQEPAEDVMDDADVAGLAMGWMSKGD